MLNKCIKVQTRVVYKNKQTRYFKWSFFYSVLEILKIQNCINGDNAHFRKRTGEINDFY